MTLKERILKAFEFDHVEAKDAAGRRYAALKDDGVSVISYQVEAARWEHAKHKTLITALAECAHELNSYKCKEPCLCADCLAITALTRAIERLEGE